MKEAIVPYIKLLHAIYNTTIFFIFLYQGSLGLRIRKARLKNENAPFHIIKRHRTLGPILAILAIGGFIAGVMLVLIDRGHLFHYPLHFIGGALISLSILITVAISRGIKTSESRTRTWHLRIGFMIISLYVIQILLGIGIVFKLYGSH